MVVVRLVGTSCSQGAARCCRAVHLGAVRLEGRLVLLLLLLVLVACPGAAGACRVLLAGLSGRWGTEAGLVVVGACRVGLAACAVLLGGVVAHLRSVAWPAAFELLM